MHCHTDLRLNSNGGTKAHAQMWSRVILDDEGQLRSCSKLLQAQGGPTGVAPGPPETTMEQSGAQGRRSSPALSWSFFTDIY